MRFSSLITLDYSIEGCNIANVRSYCQRLNLRCMQGNGLLRIQAVTTCHAGAVRLGYSSPEDFQKQGQT